MRFFNTIVFSVLVGSFSISGAFAATFPDVPKSHTNFNAIEHFYGQGAINGYPDGTFQPEKAVNRAEALKIIFAASPRSFLINNEVSKEQFPDVPTDSWFAPFIEKAVELSIVSGNSDGTFAPARTVNKAEFLKMMLLSNQVDVSNFEGSMDIVALDVEPGPWFYPYMAFGKEFKLIFPNAQEKLLPAEPLSRGEVMQIMYNYIRNIAVLDVQNLLTKTQTKLLEAMSKVDEKDYQTAQVLSKEAVELAMEAYHKAPTEELVIDAAKLAKGFDFLIDGYIKLTAGNISAAKESTQSSIDKLDEITHPSVIENQVSIRRLATKVLAQIVSLEMTSE